MDRHDTPDDAAPDAFLRAALRHAPDRDLRPPAALSAAILDAARRSVAPPPMWRRALQGLIDAFEATRRPAVAGALASLMLGTVVVLMWREGPPPEALPRVDAPAPASVATAPAVPAAQPATRPEPAVREPEAPRRAAKERAAAAEVAEPRRRAAPGAPAVVPAPAPSPRPAPAPVAVATAPAEPPSAAQPLAHDAGEPPPPAERREALAKAAPAETAPSAVAPAPAATMAEQARSGPAGGVAGLTAAARRRAAAEPAADPLAAVLPARRPDTGANAVARMARDLATDAAPQAAGAWLGELRAAARGRWESVEAPGSLPWVVLPADAGAPSPGRVAIDGEAAWWQPADAATGRAWRAPLPPEALARLREAMGGWAPSPSGRP